MEESKAASTSAPASQPTTRAGSAATDAASSAPPTRPGSAFLFDRAQLERERLARQKRLRPDIVPEADAADDDDDDEGQNSDDEDGRSAKRQRVSSTSAPSRANVVPSSTSRASSRGGMSRAASGADTGDGLFFEGELRQTANKHVDPAKDTRPVFRLTDILAPVRTAYMPAAILYLLTPRIAE